MPTKAELEKQIMDLQGDVARAEAALNHLGRRNLIEVAMPWAEHAFTTAGAPYVKGEKFEDRDFMRQLIMIPLAKILSDICPPQRPGTKYRISTVGELRFSEAGSQDHAKALLVPVQAARLIGGLIDGAAEFANLAYRSGFRDGSDALTRLVDGETSADQFNESRAQHLARGVQEPKTMTFQLEHSIHRHFNPHREADIPAESLEEIYPGDDHDNEEPA